MEFNKEKNQPSDRETKAVATIEVILRNSKEKKKDKES